MVYKSRQIFLPFCHNSRVWQTDGQTDRILITIPRLHYMQRGKNGLFRFSYVFIYLFFYLSNSHHKDLCR